MSLRKPADPAQAACLIFAILAAAILFVISPWGLGLSPDSISYFRAARAIAEHRDFGALPTHWPPLYPIMLAVGSVIYGEIEIGARVLQGVFLALNILLFTMLGWRLLERPTPFASFLVFTFIVLFALQPTIWFVHLWLWTEPAFLSMCFMNVLIMERALRNASHWRWLVVGGLVAGLAVMVRYAGLFLIGTNMSAILVLATSWSLRDRIARSVIVGIVGVAPLLAWSAFNHLRGAGAGVRSLVYHPLTESHIQQAFETVSGWLSLDAQFGWIVMILLLLLLVIPWFPNKCKPDRLFLARFLSIYTLLYVVFILLSISWADAHTPLDARILVPIYPGVFLLALYACWSIPWKWPRAAGVLLVAFPLLLNLPASYGMWKSSFHDGMGVGSRVVQEMPVLEFIRRLPSGWSASTNSPEVFYLYLKQRATMFPRTIDPGTRIENSVFLQELADMANRADLLAYLSVGGYRWYLPSAEQLSTLEGFTLVYAQPDAAVWVRSDHVRSRD